MERPRRREELSVRGPAAGVGVDVARLGLLVRLSHECLVDAREELIRDTLVYEEANRREDQRHREREAEREPDPDRQPGHGSARSR